MTSLVPSFNNVNMISAYIVGEFFVELAVFGVFWPSTPYDCRVVAILEILKAHDVDAISDKAGPGASTRLDKFEVVEACRGPELVLACKHGRGNAWDGVFREVDVWQPAQHKNGEEKM